MGAIVDGGGVDEAVVVTNRLTHARAHDMMDDRGHTAAAKELMGKGGLLLVDGNGRTHRGRYGSS